MNSNRIESRRDDITFNQALNIFSNLMAIAEYVNFEKTDRQAISLSGLRLS